MPANVTGWDKVLASFDTTLTALMMMKAAGIMQAELTREAQKALSRRVGVVGKEIGKDRASKEASNFIRSIRVKSDGKDLVISWSDGDVVTQVRGGVEGASWIHPSIKKGGFMQRGIDRAREKISSMLAEEITKRWAANR